MLKGACKEQRDLFEAEWPEGADATIENVRRAQELGLNLAWGEHWFPADPWKAYYAAVAPARKAYEEATSQAWEAYHEAIAPAWVAREEAIAQAWVVAYIASVAEREAQPSKAS